jgi:hypothetical protein
MAMSVPVIDQNKTVASLALNGSSCQNLLFPQLKTV